MGSPGNFHTHTHTFTQIKLLQFFRKIAKSNTREIKTILVPQNLIHVKFKFFNENIRSNKNSEQTERNKLKYLHYLNKMIEKYKMRKFIFSEVLCF